MKIALIGKGKTGGEILNLHSKKEIEIFDSKNPVTKNKLKKCDIAIAFVTSEILQQIYPILIESRIPLVSGVTGFDWSNEKRNQLTNEKLTWISGSNFSLGMRVIHQMIKKLNFSMNLFDQYDLNIHEIHHAKKLDAPSGTALSWNQWLNENANITHERVGDVVGDHTVTLTTHHEVIRLQHKALNRKVFAKGALWAANYLIQNKNELNYGLHFFEDITEKLIKEYSDEL